MDFLVLLIISITITLYPPPSHHHHFHHCRFVVAWHYYMENTQAVTLSFRNCLSPVSLQSQIDEGVPSEQAVSSHKDTLLPNITSFYFWWFQTELSTRSLLLSSSQFTGRGTGWTIFVIFFTGNSPAISPVTFAPLGPDVLFCNLAET